MNNDVQDLFGQKLEPARKRQQLPLPLGWAGLSGSTQTRFYVGASNREAYDHVMGFPSWAMPASILCGARGCGKSLLASQFEQAGGGTIVETAPDSLDEEALFHLWNRAAEQGRRVLIIDNVRLGGLAVIDRLTLPDLKTRLATAPVVTIGAPDLELGATLIDAWLDARGVVCEPGTGASVAPLIERSYAALHGAVAAIEAHVHESGRAVALRRIRQLLASNGLLATGLDDSGLQDGAGGRG